MSEELDVLKLVTQRLRKDKISYLVSGSMAANYYTTPRMTRDVDIVIELLTTHINGFVKAFKQDFYLDEAVIEDEVARKGMFNLIHKEYAFKIDFIIHQHTAFQDSSFKRAKEVRVADFSVSLISLEDLIIAKLFWAKDSFSELQLNDIRNLLSFNKGIDQKYLKKWVEALKLENVYRKVI